MKKILFVDDEKSLHPLIQSYFPKEQFRMICAFDGLEGMQKCRNEDFDLIILDYKMPKMDGLKFYQQLRDIQEARKVELTPIVFISESIDELKSKSNKWLRCEFLTKPFEKSDLLNKIQMLREDRPKAIITAKAEGNRTVNPGEEIILQGQKVESIFYVVSGVLECSTLRDGKKFVIGEVGTGELVGQMALISGKESLITVSAIERTELILIPGDKIMAIVNGQPKWIKMMLESLSKRLNETIKRIA